MNQPPHSFGAIMKRPSAFLPLVMSLTALTLVLGHIAIYGAAREADEGAVAHLWQLLMAGQMPVLAFFPDQVAASCSQTDTMCTLFASWSYARITGPHFFPKFVNQNL
jgi:hypothetical protein